MFLKCSLFIMLPNTRNINFTKIIALQAKFVTGALPIAVKLTTVSPSLAQTKQILFLKKQNFSGSLFIFTKSQNYEKTTCVPLHKYAPLYLVFF